MGLVKVVLKILMLLAIAAAVAAVVALVKKPAAEPVSYESWPDVPRKVTV